jgi:RNA polymerase sigma-70 factor (ECF subfamily)
MERQEDARGDIALIERIVARDQLAIGDLYDRHHRLLFGLILRIIGDRSEAEEILQEVFVLVWTRAETYNVSLGPPVAWLVRIARNRAIDRRRSNTVRLRAVVRALESLPREQHQLIEQAYFLGLTQTELAERFKLPLGTVKTRIRTGMLALREQLSQVFIEQ